MYSRKENVNQLTALLVKYGIRNAVVCPGSRNAPVTHNLVMHPDITCHSAVDERSAGFYALGLCLQTHLPTVVCVTSGTALLNLSPAVAEAFYRDLRLSNLGSVIRRPQTGDFQPFQGRPGREVESPLIAGKLLQL